VSASASISVDAGEPTVRLIFRLTLTGAGGAPVAGEEVVFRVEGDGSLQPRHDAKDLRRVTDASGQAEITWYRRSIFGRHVRATLSVDPPQPGYRASLEQVGSLPALQTAGA
jgi:hypothetical protein